MVAFLCAAARRESFTLLDAGSLSVFASTPVDFFDGMHLQAPTMRRLLACVLRHARSRIRSRRQGAGTPAGVSQVCGYST
jgi:hypothetical protein